MVSENQVPPPLYNDMPNDQAMSFATSQDQSWPLTLVLINGATAIAGSLKSLTVFVSEVNRWKTNSDRPTDPAWMKYKAERPTTMGYQIRSVTGASLTLNSSKGRSWNEDSVVIATLTLRLAAHTPYYNEQLQHVGYAPTTGTTLPGTYPKTPFLAASTTSANNYIENNDRLWTPGTLTDCSELGALPVHMMIRNDDGGTQGATKHLHISMYSAATMAERLDWDNGSYGGTDTTGATYNTVSTAHADHMEHYVDLDIEYNSGVWNRLAFITTADQLGSNANAYNHCRRFRVFLRANLVDNNIDFKLRLGVGQLEAAVDANDSHLSYTQPVYYTSPVNGTRHLIPLGDIDLTNTIFGGELAPQEWDFTFQLEAQTLQSGDSQQIHIYNLLLMPLDSYLYVADTNLISTSEQDGFLNIYKDIYHTEVAVAEADTNPQPAKIQSSVNYTVPDKNITLSVIICRNVSDWIHGDVIYDDAINIGLVYSPRHSGEPATT